MKLSELITVFGTDFRITGGAGDPEIGGIRYDSRAVTPGDLFVAMTGQTQDGYRFVPSAVAAGAVAVVSDRPVATDVPVVVVENPRRALALLVARYFGNPAGRLTMIGITGTNGKTTTCYLVERMLSNAGFRVGVIGTLGYRYGENAAELSMTTPESADLHRVLAEMAASGVTHVVMEVSSHALDLYRVEGCRFAVAAFTNLTQDHLDYHGDLDRYWACKRRLFEEYLTPEAAAAVINTDDPRGQNLAQTLGNTVPPPTVWTVGRGAENRVRPAADVAIDRRGVRATVDTPMGALSIASPLVGAHNLENLLVASGIGLALGLSPEAVSEGLAALPAVPGRLEPVPAPDGRLVAVDYAHTPDALKNVLQALRALSDERIICVFGCGGDRDRTKRPQMGKIAATLADLAVVTSDNPRTESPAAIIDGILAGVRPTGCRRYRPTDLKPGFDAPAVTVEPNREQAIAIAIAAAGPNDTVLIAGKGHETYQILGRRKIDFDDRRVAAGALAGKITVEPVPADPDTPLPWRVERLIEATGAEPLHPGALPPPVTTVGIDSRRIGPDAAYVAIRGEVHDGHRFVADVVEKGVRVVVVDAQGVETLPEDLRRRTDIACLVVPDTVAALGRIATYHRLRHPAPVIAITGSNGKTSTRQMTADVISRGFRLLSTAGNLNNEIGLPLTLLGLAPIHQRAVVELGMNRAGEIGRLTEIAGPAIGVITNIGPAHLEFLGSLEGVARAKGELVERLPPDGLAVLNADDPFCMTLAEKAPCPVFRYGTAKTADVRVEDIREGDAGIRFRLHLPTGGVEVAMSVFGRFMALNAAAAAAVGHLNGLSPEEIAAGLAAFQPVHGRMGIVTTPNGANLIDDTYNANPASMAAAIETLSAMAGSAPRYLVVGDMKELGETSADFHRDIGTAAVRSGVHRLYAAGEFAEAVAEGATAAGLSPEAVVTGDHRTIIADLKDRVRAGDWVLIKGSRAMGMETVVVALSGAAADDDNGKQRNR